MNREIIGKMGITACLLWVAPALGVADGFTPAAPFTREVLLKICVPAQQVGYDVRGTMEEYDISPAAETLRAKAAFDSKFLLGPSTQLKTVCSPYETRTTDSPPIYVKSFVTFQNDGSSWFKLLERLQVSSGEMALVKRATIENEPPAEITDDGYLTGEAIDWRKIRLVGNMQLEDVLRDPMYLNLLRFVDDAEFPKLVYTWPKGNIEVVFDKTKNFAIKKITQNLDVINGKPAHTFDLNFSDYKQVGLFWFPTQIERRYSVNGTPQIRSLTKIDSIEAIHNLSRDAFAVNLDNGWFVQDERNGISFVTGSKPDSVVKDIKSKTGN